MKKPLIGITPLVDTARESYWMLPGYMKGLEEAGSVTVMLPLVDEEASLEQLADLCDGFLFAGGHDVSPAVYGEATTGQCGECSSARDRMETVLLNLVLRRDKPIFGICRGLQFINAALRPTGAYGQDFGRFSLVPTFGKGGSPCEQLPSSGSQRTFPLVAAHGLF